jgi:dihydrolipoamide dehydrogenase
MKKYKVIVIGSGPAGHTCAVRLSQLGAKVAIVERDYLGGICTNWGCTPSKSMIESAKIARTVRESSRYGVHVASFTTNFKEVAARRDDVIRHARAEVGHLLFHHDVDVYQGEAELLEPGKVRVREGKLDLDGLEMHYTGGELLLEADHVVLSTGSRPLMPDFVKHDDPFVVSSNRLISIGERPERLTIVGGGVIGLEFATIFANLGSQVTVVEFMDRVLATLDSDISAAISAELKAIDVRILTGHKMVGVEHAGELGRVMVENRATGETLPVESDAVLIAVGREPVIDKAMFERLGIAASKKGIGVDDFLRTSVPGIWAIGDATGKSILAHVGMQQGVVAAENIMAPDPGALRAMDYEVIPAVVYSIPEVVAVGTVPADLTGVRSYAVPFTANLRARIEDYEAGFIKIWVRDNRVIAAQGIGHNISELIQELANMIALKTPVDQVARVIHAHPTYSEITRAVLQLALGQPVDFVPEPLKLP